MGAIAAILAAVATVLLLYASLREVGLLNSLLGPRLELHWERRAPTIQATDDEHTRPKDMPFQVRLRVVNGGNTGSRDVSVFLKSVRSAEAASNDYRNEAFVPARLIWTHSESPIQDFIATNSFALCDFAVMSPCANDVEGYQTVKGKFLRGTSISFFKTQLCVEKRPRNGGAVFGGGSYQLEFEIVDRTGVCGAGELRMEIGLSCDEGDNLPPLNITVAHYPSKRRKHVGWLS